MPKSVYTNVLLFVSGVLAIFVYLLSEYKITNGELGFPLDDSWIYANFAKNFAMGHGYSYNPGEPVAGSTGPLWMLLLALSYKILLAPIFLGFLWGIIFYFMIIYLAYKISETLTGNKSIALVCSLLLGFSGFLVWGTLSGMEINLLILLTLAGFYFLLGSTEKQSRTEFLASVLWGISTGVRPESYLLILFIWAFLIYRAKTKGIGNLRYFLFHTALFFFFALPFWLLNYFTWGRIFPTTFYAKSGIHNMLLLLKKGRWQGIIEVFFANPIKFSLAYIFGSLIKAPFTIFVLLLPFAKLKKKEFLWLTIVLLIIFVYIIGIVEPHLLKFSNITGQGFISKIKLFLARIFPYRVTDRYYANLFFLTQMLGLIALLSIISNHKQLQMVCILFLSIVTGLLYYTNGKYLGIAVKNINDMQVKIGKWLNEEISPNATIMANDIGAIKFFSPQYMYDLVGITNPEVLEYIEKDGYEKGIMKFIALKKPDYLIIFNKWYPFIKERLDLFKLVREFSIDQNVICGDSIMSVYRSEIKMKRGEEDE